VDAAQAQYEHDQYRGNNGIHGKLRVGIVALPAPCERRQFEKPANLQEMPSGVKNLWLVFKFVFARTQEDDGSGVQKEKQLQFQGQSAGLAECQQFIGMRQGNRDDHVDDD